MDIFRIQHSGTTVSVVYQKMAAPRSAGFLLFILKGKSVNCTVFISGAGNLNLKPLRLNYWTPFAETYGMELSIGRVGGQVGKHIPGGDQVLTSQAAHPVDVPQASGMRAYTDLL
ncbi:hypothetical protein [Microbulbifer spongiae]|uniref:Uncharacterized protein n=1 Tax=Microbulbifer spongiae TaxID=2944933 RepID=A0ABY9EGP7_9GAMM|nr:hypothetical protein [Microbulbifer sp. MI-G]WKD51271.1 hypothetical protein M8T91_07595 [Microbulbifer sp. MI-G]